MVLGHKTREKANVVGQMTIIGDVRNKDVVIVDDMADTAGTLCKAANLIMENGASSVRAIVTHGVMSGNAIENIMNSALSEIAFTDSIPFDCSRCSKVHIISIITMILAYLGMFIVREPKAVAALMGLADYRKQHPSLQLWYHDRCCLERFRLPCLCTRYRQT
jgi:ribose-phosphate pyrophosphokinase